MAPPGEQELEPLPVIGGAHWLASVLLCAALLTEGHEILLFSLLAGQGMRYA